MSIHYLILSVLVFYSSLGQAQYITTSRMTSEGSDNIVIINSTKPWSLSNSSAMQNFMKKDNIIAKGQSEIDTISIHTNNTFQLYTLKTDTEVTVSGLRQLPLQGQSNFRDLGGYITTDNRMVKWGLLFRSGQLSNLSKEDLSYLATIPLTTIIDFRSNEESEEHKTRLPKTVLNELHLPIVPGNLSKDKVMDLVMKGDNVTATQFLLDINEQLVLLNQDQYKSFFKEVQQADTPLMFNCTAGKDRTGLAAALLLAALGVDHQLIIEDYLLTNTFVNLTIEKIQDQYPLDEKQAAVLLTLLTVQEQYLSKALNTIKLHYGTVESFLTDKLDVDICLLRTKYLY